MTPQYTQEQYEKSSSTEHLLMQCEECGKVFTKRKSEIAYVIKNPNSKKHGVKFCSRKCQTDHKKTKKEVQCSHCGKTFLKEPFQIKKSKSGRHFCSKSCAAKYNNTHKTKGTRKSKLEVWLEGQLPKLYSNLEFHFNRKDAINSELDIYIPELKLAFELNGIFHYEPIFGQEKLAQTQANDKNKFQACQENGISLCIIDTSGQKYFKPKTSQKYLDIICNIISKKAPNI